MAAELLVLASASARRRALLDQIGVPHVVRAAEVDESLRDGEPPQDYVVRLARAKAEAVLAAPGLPAGSAVLAADTAVVADGRIFGKPADEDDAVRMLRALSSRTHEVLTAVALATGGALRTALGRSRVTFRDIGEAECRRYWATGEPAGKAGAYAIQGFGAVFVERLEGSFSCVVGLPLYETARLLDEAGIARWRPA